MKGSKAQPRRSFNDGGKKIMTLALMAIPVDEPGSAVMAGVVPAIHPARLGHRVANTDNSLFSIY